MNDGHPDSETLQRFRLGALSASEAGKVVRHLLRGCTLCLSRIWRQAPPQENSEYDTPLDIDFSILRELASSMERERFEAPQLYEQLVRHPPARQQVLTRNNPRFQTLGMVEFLLEKCFESGFREPMKAVELAELAILVLDNLNQERYGSQVIADYKARAYAYLANAQRITNDFRAAEKSFQMAGALLREGTGDPLEKAILAQHKATLRKDQRRFNEACRLLDQSIVTFHRLGERRHLGRSLITKGLLEGYAGNYAAAIRHLEKGIELVDHNVDQRLALVAEHNRVLFLTESGRHFEARARLQRIYERYTRVGDQMQIIRRRWLEAKIARGLGETEEAERAYEEVREEFLSRNLPFDAALASLELAAIYSEQGRTAEVRRLAAEMLPVFESRDIHREAMAALLFFQQAAEKEEATLDLIQEVLGFLKRSQNNPELRFELPT